MKIGLPATARNVITCRHIFPSINPDDCRLSSTEIYSVESPHDSTPMVTPFISQAQRHTRIRVYSQKEEILNIRLPVPAAKYL